MTDDEVRAAAKALVVSLGPAYVIDRNMGYLIDTQYLHGMTPEDRVRVLLLARELSRQVYEFLGLPYPDTYHGGGS